MHGETGGQAMCQLISELGLTFINHFTGQQTDIALASSQMTNTASDQPDVFIHSKAMSVRIMVSGS